jgi:hypothetical protein
MANLPHHPVVVFSIPSSVPQIIIAATAVVNDMTLNITSFNITAAILTAVANNIQALATAESNLLNGTGSAEDRDVALALVVTDINMLKLVVQTAVNAAPALAEAIAAKASMRIRISNIRQKVVFHAKNSLVPGAVELFAPGVRGRCFHEWAISPDGSNWTPLTTTIKASTGVSGLTPMTRQYFRHRVTTVNEGTGNWDQSFGIIILG